MKVTFVLPAIGKKHGIPYIGTWKMEPLMMGVLKALTPPDVETVLFDDRIELVDFETTSDLVAISVETYTARRAYQIADRFRSRGVPVVLGGYHVTLLPQEAARHADAIVTGNAEGVWPRLIDDARDGKLKKHYACAAGFCTVLPDRSLCEGKRYLPITLVETGRGCCYSCSFCSIARYYGSHYHARPVRDVVREIERTTSRYLFLVDDNISARPAYLCQLARELIPLGVLWASQGCLTLARDQRLLDLLRRSGCIQLLIGFESMESENLRQMGKPWMARLGGWDGLVDRIHAAGISIYATFLFGFDGDTPASFDRTLDFAGRHRFFFTAFNHLLAFPGTPLYARLKREGRLLRPRWWLDEDYRYGDIPFRPKNMDPVELSERCAAARRRFYRLPSVVRRGFAQLSRNPAPSILAAYLGQNLNLRGEVEGKLGLPVGNGLDELPK
jgi:radical SAM superfamily enzyme YgiQ (UPF0313 family)